MPSTTRPISADRPLHVLLLAAAALALGSAGCGKVGCFQWTQAEGECPAQDEALPYFTGGSVCNAQVESVDSEPDYDGDYCCYDITKRSEGIYYDCVEPAGGGSAPPPAPASHD